MKPTSSKCPATTILGPFSSPTFLAMTLPKLSVSTVSAYGAMYFFMTSRGARSLPAIPFASVKSLNICNVGSSCVILLPPTSCIYFIILRLPKYS